MALSFPVSHCWLCWVLARLEWDYLWSNIWWWVGGWIEIWYRSWCCLSYNSAKAELSKWYGVCQYHNFCNSSWRVCPMEWRSYCSLHSPHSPGKVWGSFIFLKVDVTLLFSSSETLLCVVLLLFLSPSCRMKFCIFRRIWFGMFWLHKGSFSLGIG